VLRHQNDDALAMVERSHVMGETPAVDDAVPGAGPEPGRRDLVDVTATLAATARAVGQHTAGVEVSPADLLDALVLLRWARTELAGIEPTLIAAARAAGVSWRSLAPALGVASRQAAERRYLRSTAAATDQSGANGDARVQAERDRRAAHRAVAQWANDNTADLRQLAGQITALPDLDAAATDAVNQLHDALGDVDASALPALLAATHPHLPRHPDLASQIDIVSAHADHIRQRAPRRHGDLT
jgi:hypothetical protein